MAFTATVTDIRRQQGQILVVITYLDDATAWTNVDLFKYDDDGSVTQAKVITDVTAKGQSYKTNLAQNNTLQSKVGTVIII